MKKTKIIATLWPATDSIEIIEKLYKAWVNVVRMNYSHSNYEYFESILEKVNKLNKEWKTNLGILTDTKWPEIRTKTIDEKIDLVAWEIFYLTTLSNERKNFDKKVIVCDYESILTDLNIWHIIDIDTGLLKVKVIEKTPTELICEALNTHKIWSKRHLNLPWIKIKLPAITENDKKDIEFAVKKWTDFIALSFVRNRQNIIDLKKYLKEINAPEYIQIISKIENQEALDNIDEIIDETDWIMIARWDLWAEIPFETLPIVQKQIADKCKLEWKFFIIATQMLESMIENPISTRAEVTDIFNACMQKTDCTMLSWETANWKYPIEAVEVMSKVLKYTESQIIYKHNYFSKDLWVFENKKLLIKNAVYTAENIGVKAMVIFTKSWFTAKTISSYRPNLPVFVFTSTNLLLKKLTILFWLKTFFIENISNEENIINAMNLLKDRWFLNNWDKIVTVYWISVWEDMIPSIQVREVK